MVYNGPAVMDPGTFETICREAGLKVRKFIAGSRRTGHEGNYETGVFLGNLYLGYGEKRPMSTKWYTQVMPNGYPYRVQPWPLAIRNIARKLHDPSRRVAFLKRARRHGFTVEVERKVA